ncbi:hypothetical protein [Streptomyces sp. AK02-01A]|uniref:hypothetical protein n=1 Tax=Streptomyces sp. AK02-01A TaxID=3028648 RepID=UPI0029AB858C|nr:hypothetical protein [Streptomyces sp. AK02-01A]MDX3851802.1 hypothetical protein [Streptomyces sp. AK02-01A]
MTQQTGRPERRIPGTHCDWQPPSAVETRKHSLFATDTETVRRLLAALCRLHRRYRAERLATPPASINEKGNSRLNQVSAAGEEPGATGRQAGSAGIEESPEQTAYAIDLLTITHTIAGALARRLALPERPWVDITTKKLRGHLELLLRQDLGDTGTALYREMREDADRLLDHHTRPTAHTPPGYAYEHLRALASVTRSAVGLYRLRQAVRESEPRPKEAGQ